MRSYAIRNGVTGEKSQLHSTAMKAIVLAVVVGTAFQAEAQARPECYPQIAPLEEYLTKDRGPESRLLTFSTFVTSRQCVMKIYRNGRSSRFGIVPRRLLVRHSFSSSEVLGL